MFEASTAAPVTVSASRPLSFRFDLLPTPNTRRDARHFRWRYMNGMGCDYDGPGPGGRMQPHCLPDPNFNVTALGCNVVQIHHGTRVNPYIDYPLDAEADRALAQFSGYRRQQVRMRGGPPGL